MTTTAPSEHDTGLQIAVARGSAGCALVAAGGDLDLFTGPTLARAVRELVLSGRTLITLDLTELTFIDSAGLRFITTSAASAQDHGGDLILGGTSPIVRRFLALTAISHLRAIRDHYEHPSSPRTRPGQMAYESE